MHRLIGKCSQCNGNVYLNRNGKPGVCDSCGAVEEIKIAQPNLPVIKMKEKDK